MILSPQSIYELGTLKYFAKKSDVLVVKLGTRCCVVVYRSGDNGVLGKAPQNNFYLNARRLISRARVGGAFLSSRWFPGTPRGFCLGSSAEKGEGKGPDFRLTEKRKSFSVLRGGPENDYRQF